MSKCINNVILLGNLADDPQVRYKTTDIAVVMISLATNKITKSKTNKKTKVLTQWHKIVTFNRMAEIAAQFLKKGSKVYIEGSSRANKWLDYNGDDHITTEIICSDFINLDSKSTHNSNFIHNNNIELNLTVVPINSQGELLNDNIPF